MKEIVTNNFQETKDLAKDFARQLFKKPRESGRAVVVALEGDLGSGKTTFAQGMAEGLGIREQITSPTFVLMKKYSVKTSNFQLPTSNFYHFDCYRIEKSWQMQDLGFEEIINNPENIIAIEWPERISDILPENGIVIKFEWMDENKRKITFPENF